MEGWLRELFQARPGSGGGELSLGMPGADLLAVSRSGELAVLLHECAPRMHTGSGALALVPASGGTPRELAEDVVWADWAPEAKRWP